MSSADAPIASVLIPAHNEEKVIGPCLDALVSQIPTGSRLEIVVAANGCSDRTVEVAQAYPQVSVLDLDVASKHGALTEGERACTAFPRIYLDADIVLGPNTLLPLIEALRTDEARVAAPAVRFHVADSSPAVRSFYRAFEELPYVTDGLVGLGVYGISRAGRARFAQMPQVIADDLFIQRLFDPAERLVTPGFFAVRAPRDLRSLVKVRTRVASGNAQLARAMSRPRTDPDAAPAKDPAEDPAESSDAGNFSASTTATLRALADLARRRPTAALDIAVYIGVTVASRLRARRRGPQTWERDSSTR